MANLHVIAGASGAWAPPVIRRIGLADIRDALAKGVGDFLTMPSHLVFLCLIYPVVGACLAATNALYLLYPLASGFALVGPFAAIGLYELSRRRELGMDTSWRHAVEVLRSPAMPSILALGLLLEQLAFQRRLFEYTQGELREFGRRDNLFEHFAFV